MKRAALFLYLLSLYIGVNAQEIGTNTFIKAKNVFDTPLTVDRPDQTESPNCIPIGFLQVEAGMDYQWDQYKTNNIAYSYRSVSLPNLLVRYGISNHIELRMEGNYGRDRIKMQPITRESTTAGVYPLLVGAKMRLCEQKGVRPAVAVLVKVYTPFHTRNNLHFSAKYTAGLTGAFSYAITERLVLDASAGASLDQFTGRLATRYSLSQAINLTEKLCFFGEIFGLKSVEELAQYGADTGLLYLLSENLQIDIYAGKSISYQAIDLFIGAGMGIRCRIRKKNQ